MWQNLTMHCMDSCLCFIVRNSADKFAYLQAQITVGIKQAVLLIINAWPDCSFPIYCWGNHLWNLRCQWGQSAVLVLVSDPLQSLWLWVCLYLMYLLCCILDYVLFKRVLKAFGVKTVNCSFCWLQLFLGFVFVVFTGSVLVMQEGTNTWKYSHRLKTKTLKPSMELS